MTRHGPRPGVRALWIAALVVGCADGAHERGRELIATYGCAGCHHVPGVPGRHGTIGPSLDGWRSRSYIAGRLHNTPYDLVQWIVDPQRISPNTAMPKLGVTEDEARHMASYLFTLE